jgi:hypothetical protein
VIERFGLRRGLGLLDRRLALCGHVHQRALPARAAMHPRMRRQQGSCDVPCDLPSCELPSCELIDPVCEVLSCGSDVYDCWRSRRNSQARTSAEMDAVTARVREQQAGRRREVQRDARVAEE